MVDELLSLPERVAAIERIIAGSERPYALVRPEAAAIRLWTPDLAGRHREVLPYMAAGWTNEQIAARLGITERTARGYAGAILGTLNAQNRTTVALWALGTGQVRIDEAIELMAQHQGHLIVRGE